MQFQEIPLAVDIYCMRAEQNHHAISEGVKVELLQDHRDTVGIQLTLPYAM